VGSSGIAWIDAAFNFGVTTLVVGAFRSSGFGRARHDMCASGEFVLRMCRSMKFDFIEN